MLKIINVQKKPFREKQDLVTVSERAIDLVFLRVTHRLTTDVSAKLLKAIEFLILQSGLDTDLCYEASAFD
jgi:hypothetical protein